MSDRIIRPALLLPLNNIEIRGMSPRQKTCCERPSSSAPRIERMTHVDRLLTLFKAFRERNEEAFYRAADAIIADELTANHHSQARELQKALSPNGADQPLSRTRTGLSVLPRDRRHGEPLVSVVEPRLDSNRVILAPESKDQIDRIIQEHSQRLKLAKYGYGPKTKLLFWGPPGRLRHAG